MNKINEKMSDLSLEEKKIPIVIHIEDYSSSRLETFIGSNLDDCLQKIILYLKPNFEITIDFPGDYETFQNLYSDPEMYKLKSFDYKIYSGDWIKPWSEQEIYENIIELIHELDVQNSILNPVIYGSDIEEEEIE